MRQDFGPVSRYWKQGFFPSILACKFPKTVSRGEIFKTWTSCLHVNGKKQSFSITMMSYWYIIILPALCMLCEGCDNCISIFLALSCGWAKTIIQIGCACMHTFFENGEKNSPLSKTSRYVCTGRAFILVCYQHLAVWWPTYKQCSWPDDVQNMAYQ